MSTIEIRNIIRRTLAGGMILTSPTVEDRPSLRGSGSRRFGAQKIHFRSNFSFLLSLIFEPSSSVPHQEASPPNYIPAQNLVVPPFASLDARWVFYRNEKRQFDWRSRQVSSSG